MIEVKHVTKKFLTTRAIDDLTVDFHQGRIIGVIGENGSGKSTLLKLISGLLRPTDGEVLVNGELPTKETYKKIAYMSDSDRFYPYFTVGELLEFYKSQFDDFETNKAKEILDFMKIDLDKKIKHLSKGNRGRVKIAMTFARKASFLILDEPFSGLDPMVRDSIVRGLAQFIDLETQTLIITTHEIKDIEPLLDEVIVIRRGKVIARSEVDEIRGTHGLDVSEWMKRLYLEEL